MMIRKPTQVLLLISISIGLFACNLPGFPEQVGAEESDEAPTRSSPVPAPIPTDKSKVIHIQGSVTKGKISYAAARLYSLDNNEKRLLSETTSDEHGDFSFTLSDEIFPNLMIEIVTNDLSTMRCDAIQGCGPSPSSNSHEDINRNAIIDFGESFKVGSDYVLTSVLGDLNSISDDLSSSNNVEFAVTPLTHLASQYVNSISNDPELSDYALSNSLIKNIFGLRADLRIHSIPDLTNIDELKDADPDSLEYALFLSGIAGLLQTGRSLDDINEIITGDIISNNGQFSLRSSINEFITLEKILTYALETAEALNHSSNQISSVIAKFQLRLDEVQQLPLDSISDAIADEHVNASTLAKADAFLAVLHEWWFLFNPDAENGLDFTPSIQSSTQVRNLNEHILNILKLSDSVSAANNYAKTRSEASLLESLCADAGGLENSCLNLISGSSLKSLCDSGDVLNLGACEVYAIHSDIELISNGIPLSYNLFTNKIKIYGTLDDSLIAIDLTLPPADSNAVDFEIEVSGYFIKDSRIADIAGTLSVPNAENISEDAFLQSEMQANIYFTLRAHPSTALSLNNNRVYFSRQENSNFSIAFSIQNQSGSSATFNYLTQFNNDTFIKADITLNTNGKQVELTQSANQVMFSYEEFLLELSLNSEVNQANGQLSFSENNINESFDVLYHTSQGYLLKFFETEQILLN